MIKKILFPVASIIKLFIFLNLITINTSAIENNQKIYKDDLGVVSLIYHRFGEEKYPSTNVKMDIFEKQIYMIKNEKLNFIKAEEFIESYSSPKKERAVLLTIDDAFTSFYENAWPFLKKNEIPFILFVSTEPVGKPGYMNWEQIKEIEKSNLGYIGNHSHSHEYLVSFSFDYFKDDIQKSIKLFEKEIGYNPKIFSYPFGEYSLKQKNFIKKNFKLAFGQHSGVVDINKDKYELPRFPINEKYGDLDRFKFLINLHPLQYKSLKPEEKFINKSNNPPNFEVEFFEDQKNVNKINCFSDEGNEWKKSKIKFNKNILKIDFRDKYYFRRGRINCSLNDDGTWRWFGVQFSVDVD